MRRADFDLDLPYGEAGEAQIRRIFTRIASGDGRVEVKRKRRIDSTFYVEQAQSPFGKAWRASGIAITTADLWAWPIATTGMTLFVETPLLKAALHHPHTRRAQSQVDPYVLTRGRLLTFNTLLDTAREKAEP